MIIIISQMATDILNCIGVVIGALLLAVIVGVVLGLFSSSPDKYSKYNW